MKSLITLLFLSSFLGCASLTNWTPTVDPHNDPNAANIEKDLSECKVLAKKVTGGGLEEGATLGAGLAAVGAGVGASVGGSVGAAAGLLPAVFRANCR